MSLTISVAPRLSDKVKEAIHPFDFPNQVGRGGHDCRVRVILRVLLNIIRKFAESSSNWSWDYCDSKVIRLPFLEYQPNTFVTFRRILPECDQ